MGLFSSKSSTSNLTTLNEQSAEVNQQIRDGIAIGTEGTGNTVTMTDGGAIAGMQKITQALSDSADRSSERAFDLGDSAIGEALGFGRDALNFAGDQSSRAFSFGERSQDLVSEALKKSFEFGDRSLAVGSAAIGSAISAAKPIEAETMQKLSLYAALAFVAVVIAFGIKK